MQSQMINEAFLKTYFIQSHKHIVLIRATDLFRNVRIYE